MEQVLHVIFVLDVKCWSATVSMPQLLGNEMKIIEYGR